MLGALCAGDQIANDQLSFAAREYWEGVVALIGLTCLWNLLGYLLLRRGMPKFLVLSSSAPAAPKVGSEEPGDPPSAGGGLRGWLRGRHGGAAGKIDPRAAAKEAAHVVVATPAI